MSKMNPVVHFEMPAEDTKRMSDFYTNAFGWGTHVMGEEMGNYVVVTTSETDDTGRPKMAGTINGGFYPVKKDDPPHYPSIVIAVEDIIKSVKKVTEAGGKVIGDPVEIPKVGLYVSFIDTEGNRVSILQPSMIEPE
jgi:predicted enzyme related to lactoylglutathione lyase